MCWLGHVAVVAMKVRQHLKMRFVIQEKQDNDEAAVAASAAAAAVGAASYAAGASPADDPFES